MYTYTRAWCNLCDASSVVSSRWVILRALLCNQCGAVYVFQHMNCAIDAVPKQGAQYLLCRRACKPHVAIDVVQLTWNNIPGATYGLQFV
eukprot:3926768-Pyramimonas_sp.AAC.1